MRSARANKKTILWSAGQWLATVVFTGALLSACGGSGSNSNSDANGSEDSTELGKLAVSVTDAEGDFLTYTVAIDSITLARANGESVQVIPASSEIDFAQYVDVSELVSIGDVPAGVYTTIEFNLDYSNAVITVQDDQGEGIPATPLNADGTPLTEMSIELQFANEGGVVVSPGVVANVTLDFDLAAANEIAIVGDTAEVVVAPVLLVDTTGIEPRDLRVRGLLQTVDATAMSFNLDLLPFRVQEGDFGTVDVLVTDETSFLIDDETLAGTDGLAAMAALSEGAAVVSQGEWDWEQGTYTASYVLAGTALPIATQDLLRGVVLAREGDNLIVDAAVVELDDGQLHYAQRMTVSLAELNQVVRYEDGFVVVDPQAISVGSVISAIGEYDSEQPFAAQSARVWRSAVAGTVVATAPLALDMQLLSAHRPAAYDFNGTGTDASTDAEADNYEINTGVLDLTAIELGAPIRVRGRVAEFGGAPEDFIADSLINSSEMKARLSIGYGLGGSDNAILNRAENQLQINLVDVGFRHHVARAGVITDVTPGRTDMLISAPDTGGIYALVERTRLTLYSDFAEFTAAMDAAMSDNRNVFRIEAHGKFDDASGEFNAAAVVILLVE